jgi:hypothetical protein
MSTVESTPTTTTPTTTTPSTTTTGVSSTGDVVELETHANWRAGDIGDVEHWTLRLTDAHHAELDAALAHARSVTDEVLDVTVDDFPLPTLAPLLTDLAEELVNGRGFARIASLDVERLGAEDASWMYWGIGMHLGEPWPQNAKGHLLGDVKDQGKAPDDPTARGNEIGGHPLGFHSDGSDLVGLMCIDSGVSGGESLVANALGAHNALVRSRPDLAAALYEPLPYDFRGEQRQGARPFYEVPATPVPPAIACSSGTSARSSRRRSATPRHRASPSSSSRRWTPTTSSSTTRTTVSRWRCARARSSSSTTTTSSTGGAATSTARATCAG